MEFCDREDDSTHTNNDGKSDKDGKYVVQMETNFTVNDIVERE